MVPSLSEVTLIPPIVHVPPATTVVVIAVVLWVPLLATIEIVAPTSLVPLALVLPALLMLIGLVAVVIDTAGATTSFVEVVEAVAVLLAASVAVTLYVIVPSVSELTLMPLMLQVPPDPIVVVLAAVVCVPSVTGDRYCRADFTRATDRGRGSIRCVDWIRYG